MNLLIQVLDELKVSFIFNHVNTNGKENLWQSDKTVQEQEQQTSVSLEGDRC